MSLRVTKSNIDKTQIYINKAEEKHGKGKYNYSLVKIFYFLVNVI